MLPHARFRPPSSSLGADSPPTRPEGVRRAVAIGALLVLSAAVSGAQDSTAAAKPAAAPGVYTEEQSGRGNGVFSKVCLECHTQNDMSGADFRLNWNGRTVFDLFDRIRTTMPEAAPGSLTLEEYTDVTSYILKLNGLPAGSTPMPGDSTLVNIKLEIAAPPPPGLVSHFVPRRPSRAHARIAPRPSLRPDHSLLFRGF